LDSESDYAPLALDTRKAGKRRLIVKRCPECSKPLRAYSEKQWRFIYLAHSTLSKKHRKVRS